MPPARRRVANKAKANGHLRLGDLVLAKVKGFPPWPAKISRPEEWDKAPDPKKFFVQFFGTKEIAFVAPADIRVFTSEDKINMSSRLQGKTRYFTQAVKEICAAFDEIQKQKASGDDTDDSRIDSEAPPVDEIVSNPKDTSDAVTSHAEKDNIHVSNVGSNSEECLLKTRERVSLDEKLTESDRPNESSSVSSPLVKSKLSTGPEIKNSSKSTLKGASNVNDFGQHDNENSISANGSKPRKLVTGSKRRREVEDDINKNGGSSTGTLLIVGKSTGSADLFRPGEETFKSRKKGKDASSVKLNSPGTFKPDSNGSTGEKRKNLVSKNCSTGSADLFRPGEETFNSGKKGKDASAVKLNSPGTFKPDSNGSTGEKGKNLISKKTSLEVKNELQEADGKTSSIGKNNQVHAKHNVVASESLHAMKKLKRMDARDDLASGHIPKDVKTVLPCSSFVEDKSSKMLELKRSTLNSKTEKSSVHELLPKTHVHGGGAKNIKSPLASDIKGNNAHSEKSDAAKLAHRNYSELEEGHLKEPCSQLHVDASSIKPPEKEKADEATPVHIPLSQDKLDSKKFPFKVTRVSSPSPVKSPQPVPATTESNDERNKSSIPLLKDSNIATPKKDDNGSSKSSHNLNSSQNQVSAHKKKLASSAENSKTTPKTSNIMKHLIAAAQAKWKKAHSQYLSSDIHNVQAGTPSPSTVQPRITRKTMAQKKNLSLKSQKFFLNCIIFIHSASRSSSSFLEFLEVHLKELSSSLTSPTFFIENSAYFLKLQKISVLHHVSSSSSSPHILHHLEESPTTE